VLLAELPFLSFDLRRVDLQLAYTCSQLPETTDRPAAAINYR